MMIERIISYLETKCSLKKVNLIKTLYINFRVLPFYQALKFPIYIYGKWDLRYLGGNVIINTPIKRGMIKFGVNLAGYVIADKGSILMHEGARFIFNGQANICQGSSIVIHRNAMFELGDCVNIGDNVKIICYCRIFIGCKTGITWESQVTDFNFHFIENMNRKEIFNLLRPIEIGEYCWIGNRTTIMPGTKLPNRTIVASNSLLNKDYTLIGIEPYSLLGGIPAKLLKKGVKRIYSKENEQLLMNYFSEHITVAVSSEILTHVEVE